MPKWSAWRGKKSVSEYYSLFVFKNWIIISCFLSSTSVASSPGSWLAAHITDIKPDLQVFLSWGLTVWAYTHSNSSPSISFTPSWASPSSAFHQSVYHMLIWLHHYYQGSTCPNKQSLLFPEKRSRSLISNFGIRCFDRTVATFSGLILHICLIMVWLGQWPRFAGMDHDTPYTRYAHMATAL